MLEAAKARDLDVTCVEADAQQWRMFDAASPELQVTLRGAFEQLVARKSDGTGIDLDGRVWAIRATV